MRSFSEFMADKFKMPKDVLMNLPCITIGGDKEIFIENHSGLKKYESGCISIKMKNGYIHIYGENLRIIVMQESNLVINGEFGRVEYEKFGRKEKNV